MSHSNIEVEAQTTGSIKTMMPVVSFLWWILSLVRQSLHPDTMVACCQVGLPVVPWFFLVVDSELGETITPPGYYGSMLPSRTASKSTGKEVRPQMIQLYAIVTFCNTCARWQRLTHSKKDAILNSLGHTAYFSDIETQVS